ncbi:hypothetical protein ACFQJD_12885 [Haloplanus sp. GCM10025708]|uniref:hypothetical protein n=1 Tax=Haloferacaceae TaxID=1644056 RepID=UPI0036121736
MTYSSSPGVSARDREGRLDGPALGADRRHRRIERSDGRAVERAPFADPDDAHRLVGRPEQRGELAVGLWFRGQRHQPIPGLRIEFRRLDFVDDERRHVVGRRPEFRRDHPRRRGVGPPHLHEVARTRRTRRVGADRDGHRAGGERLSDSRRSAPHGEIRHRPVRVHLHVDVTDVVVVFQPGGETGPEFGDGLSPREDERLAAQRLLGLLVDRVVPLDVFDVVRKRNGGDAADRSDESAHLDVEFASAGDGEDAGRDSVADRLPGGSGQRRDPECEDVEQRPFRREDARLAAEERAEHPHRVEIRRRRADAEQHRERDRDPHPDVPAIRQRRERRGQKRPGGEADNPEHGPDQRRVDGEL